MTVPDPDRDILRKLDRREGRKNIGRGFTAVAGAFVSGLIVFEVMKAALKWRAPAPLDGGLVVFALVATWLFLKLSKGR